MDREVRYCRTDDGVQIAYTVYGSGPLLVICPYFFESFDNEDAFGELVAGLAAGRRVARYDNRGVGLSQREGAEISVRALERDLDAVVHAAGFERFDLLGWLAGGFAAMNYAALNPDRVQRLALYTAFVTGADAMPRSLLNTLAALCRTNWRMGSQTLADVSARATDPEIGVRMAETLRNNVSGEVVAAILEDETDITEVVPEIKAPTLLLHRVSDSTIPFSGSQKLASLIPDARLLPLKGEHNYPPQGDWQAIVDAVQAFLTPAEPVTPETAERASSTFRTILFTDIVGHTAMMRRLGDEKGREVLREHETLTRGVLKEHGGSEIKTMGEGFMASFHSVTRAVECAVALQSAFHERNETAAEPLAVRVGLNAGEPIEEDGDLFGETVILAARIAAMAQGGEILASLAVRELCAGKGFLFADMGEQAMRGFEDPVRVFEIKRPA